MVYSGGNESLPERRSQTYGESERVTWTSNGGETYARSEVKHTENPKGYETERG